MVFSSVDELQSPSLYLWQLRGPVAQRSSIVSNRNRQYCAGDGLH